MKRYEVNFMDDRTGAISAIDVVTVPDEYTTDDYIKECIDNDETFAGMLEKGSFTFYDIENGGYTNGGINK